MHLQENMLVDRDDDSADPDSDAVQAAMEAAVKAAYAADAAADAKRSAASAAAAAAAAAVHAVGTVLASKAAATASDMASKADKANAALASAAAASSTATKAAAALDPDALMRHGIRQLVVFGKSISKSTMAHLSVCGRNCAVAQLGCLHGNCNMCGFKMLWSSTLRLLVLDSDGNLRSDAPPQFSANVKWERFKSTKKPPSFNRPEAPPGPEQLPAEKELNRETRSGTVVEFLDEFEAVMSKFALHRSTLLQQKQAARQCDDNMRPGACMYVLPVARAYPHTCPAANSHTLRCLEERQGLGRERHHHLCS